jgi:hypothetical protein
MEFASIPAVGSSLHPHLHISTKPPEGVPRGDRCPDIPTNTVREYTAFAHNTAFGDVFSLNVPELGGSATGRSHLSGRVLMQFGERTRDSVPIVIATMPPGGMLARPPESPIAKAFPGRLSVGLLGHDEVMHFPRVAYPMQGVCFVDDPFEIALGAVDVKTGRLLGPLLYRGFIVQNVLLALLMLDVLLQGARGVRTRCRWADRVRLCRNGARAISRRLQISAAGSPGDVHRWRELRARSLCLPSSNGRHRAHAAGQIGR